ncbi:transcriptional regulation of mitochondrial recombination-domain-containing protein [Diaporthe sp. PMI_573]|nr:transcriptional regulation of mitochondrial recombination-domain-containing protein [Diaporthaceae sp. PMI_573]
MKSSPASVVGILGRLSTGVSRVSIRHGHTTPKRKQPRHHLTGFKVGLGERIWVHHHIARGMIIYTHDPELPRDSHKGLSQIPFTVKKQKPAELRRDYWQPLCLIEVPKGLGVVGRNVMQKLREFRHRHELEWGWQADELASVSRRERGELIHNQKSNAIADIAAVLAGAGRGNKIPKPKARAVAPKAPKTLVTANIYWSNDADRHWASEWTENVTHSVGLPKKIVNPRFKTSYLLEEPLEEPAAGEAIHVQGTVAEPNFMAEQEEQPQRKKGWLGWLRGKSGSSSQETRV